jgi:hypothetical protein
VENEEEARLRIHATIKAALNRSIDSAQPISPGVIDEAVEELLPIWAIPVTVANTPGKVAAFLPFNYVIRDDDLKLVDTAFSVLTTAAGVGYFIPQLGFGVTSALTVPITGIIIALLRLLHNLRLSTRLDERDYAIMVLLARASQDGLSEQVLLDTLHSSFPDMTSDDVKERLAALAACASANGSKVILVWKDEHERWHTNGV